MRLYNVIVFVRGREPLKYRKVNNFVTLQKWLSARFDWVYMNIYDKKTREYVRRITRSS